MICTLSSCSFAYPWAALLSGKCQRNQAFILHGSILPQRETHQSCQSYHLLRNHPVLSPTHPQQMSNFTTCVSAFKMKWKSLQPKQQLPQLILATGLKKKKKEVKGKEGEKTNSLDSLICITEGLNQHYHRYSAYIDYWSGSGYLSLNTGVRQDISVFTASEFSDLITWPGSRGFFISSAVTLIGTRPRKRGHLAVRAPAVQKEPLWRKSKEQALPLQLSKW